MTPVGNPTGHGRGHDGSADDPARYLDVSARVTFDGFHLDVDLVVPAGTTVAVVGANGAGKTTLSRTIAGLQALDAGHLRVGGVVWDEPARARWLPPEARSVGLVFQDRLLFSHMSVADNVAFGLRARGVSRRDARRVATEWLDRVGLADRATTRPDELSGGQARRIALARALASDPDVILLDEPLTGLDTAAHRDMVELLTRHLADQRGAALLITHDPDEAATLADRMIVIRDGRIAETAATNRHGTTGPSPRPGP